MIIKSLARKTKTFKQLYEYINKTKTSPLYIYRNLNGFELNKEAILDEFERNAEVLSKRKNGNYLYHEIISIKYNRQLDKEKQKKILFDLSQKYLESRANKHLAFGRLHEEKGHLHFHLMISANELESEKRKRISKKEFSNIQKNLEAYLLETYPELNEKALYNKNNEKQSRAVGKENEEKIRNKEYELKKRTGKSKKGGLKDLLDTIFSNSRSQEDLINSVRTYGLTFYSRGKEVGIIYEGKRYRLKTLGLDDAYKASLNRIAVHEKNMTDREAELQALRDGQKLKALKERARESKPETPAQAVAQVVKSTVGKALEKSSDLATEVVREAVEGKSPTDEKEKPMRNPYEDRMREIEKIRERQRAKEKQRDHDLEH